MTTHMHDNTYAAPVPRVSHAYAEPVPRVSHAYAEAGLIYRLVVMQNKINISDNLISRRIQDPNYSLASFNQLLINEMLDNYSYECLFVICHTCSRT